MNSVIVSAARRTPIGGMLGELSPLTAPELGGAAIAAALRDSTLPPHQIDEVQMGCVLAAGIGQAPARQASLGAGIPDSVPCTTINKMCGSGMQTVMNAYDRIGLGDAKIVVAGGMESMSNAPYLLPRMRAGSRLGHVEATDHMFLDGLEDAYDKGRLMGEFAEECADEYRFTRREQDEFALASLDRAINARKDDALQPEISPLQVASGRRIVTIEVDEQPQRARPDKIPHLKPAFRRDGTVTAANSSSISDGAACLILATEQEAKRRKLPHLAKIVGHETAAKHPSQFTTAPSLAVQKLLTKLSWTVNEVDYWEVNEAFAVVCLAFMRDIGISHDRLNVRGGACALGHPIGASGARILVTLIHAMRAHGGRRGVAAICIGGGEATAVAFEAME